MSTWLKQLSGRECVTFFEYVVINFSHRFQMHENYLSMYSNNQLTHHLFVVDPM